MESTKPNRKPIDELRDQLELPHAYSIIAIDPDVDKSGVALIFFDPEGFVSFRLYSFSFPELCGIFFARAKYGVGVENDIIVVEKGWFNQVNYHLRKGTGLRVAARQGIDIGRNHETGRKIVEVARYCGFQVEELNPLPKRWKGKDGKITTEELEQYTGHQFGRCNQDERDAALLAFAYYESRRLRRAVAKEIRGRFFQLKPGTE